MYKILVAIVMSFMIIHKTDAGCIEGNCHNGEGVYVFKDGTKYKGTFRNFKPEGQGILLSKNNNLYKGAFLKGLKEGKGKLTFSTGDIYEGKFSKDRIVGPGKIQYQNGDYYIGEWKHEKPNGSGRYQFSDGDYYIGYFINGQFYGEGKLTRSDASYYDGKWISSKKHGQGISLVKGKKTIQVYDMNSLVKEVPYNDTETIPVETVIINMNSTQLKNCNNTFCDNVKGKYDYGDGSIYVGDFVAGQGDGNGKCTYANGDVYIGSWKNHAPHGEGKLVFATGQEYAALWDNGVPKQKVEKIKPQPAKQVTENKMNITVGNTQIYALVVGVASYNHMPSLKYTDDDAYQLYAFLKSPEGGAIPDNNIKILIDDAATNMSITANLKAMVARADANDVLMIYFSGHGLDGAFVPSDFDGHKNQLPYGDVLDILNGAKAKHKVFITDACHSGSIDIASRSPLNVALENFYAAYNTINGGTAIMMSSKKEEVSLEYGGLRQGVFSHFLINGLKGNADVDQNKIITISELYDFVSSSVRKYTANAQNPNIMGDYDKNMPVGMIR